MEMTQHIIVALIVALAAIYALWRWMPGGWRRILATNLAEHSQRAGLVDAQRAQRLAATLAQAPGCGSSCDRCGGCAGAAGRPSRGSGQS
jgi:hypothetical protein